MSHGIEQTQGTSTNPAALTGPAELGLAELDLLLPPTEASEGPLAAIEQLMIELRMEDRRAAREENELARERIQAASDARVKAIHAQADATELQGWINGVGQLGGAALMGYGGFFTKTEHSLQGYSAAGKFTESAFAIGGVVVGDDLADAQAAEVKAETAQAAAEADANDASNELQNARDDIRALLEHIQRIHDAEIAAMNAAIFLR